MTDWQTIFLGTMAVSLVLMAIAQLVVALGMMRAVKKVAESVEKVAGTVDALQRDIRPVLDKAAKIADDASRVAALAVVQVERLDVLIKSSAARIDETFGVVQRALIDPIRQGSALFSALRAAFVVVREWQSRRAQSAATATGAEDEDPLFVG